MIWAILISSILLLTGNLIYLLLKKRTEARRALTQLGQPIKRRDQLLQRIFASPTHATDSKAKTGSRNAAVERIIQQENELLKTMGDLQNDLPAKLPPQEADCFRKSLADIQKDWINAASEYNARALVYNQALRDYPGRILASFLHMKHMPSLNV